MDLTTIIDPCYPSNIFRILYKVVLLRVTELGFSKKFQETQYWSFRSILGPKTWNTLFEVLQNDRSLSLNKGENSEYFEKALIGPQMEHFYHKSGQNPLIRLALGIQLRNVFGILHDDRRR